MWDNDHAADSDDEYVDEDDYYRPGGRSAADAEQAVETLHSFFTAVSVERAARAKHRYRLVEDHLTTYLNTADLGPHLGTYPAGRIDDERRRGTPNPFFRVCAFDDFVCALEGFVTDEWLLQRRSDARTQVSLTGRLVAWLRSQQLVEMWRAACAMHDVEAAVRDARRRLAPAIRTGTGRPDARLTVVRPLAPATVD